MYFPLGILPPIMPRALYSCDLPPTLYSLMQSMVNFGEEDQVGIKDLASNARLQVFNFNYPLSTKVNKAEFETMILNKFMFRRIGFETFTSFQIHLNVKLNEIMPNYNKLFDMLDKWDLYSGGEVIERTVEKTGESENTNEKTNTKSGLNTESTSGSTTEDARFSDTPQSQIADVQNGSYVTEYNYNTNTATSSNSKNTYLSETESSSNEGTNTETETETISRSDVNKVDTYIKFMENRKNIMTLIFNDLDDLFYGLV